MWKPYKISNQIKLTAFYSLFEEIKDRSYSFPGEMHNFWECICILDGTIFVSGDERVYHLGTNQIIFHKPNELHKLNVESKTAHYLIFSFSATGELLSFFENKVFTLTSTQKNILDEILLCLHQKAEKRFYDFEFLNEHKNDNRFIQNVALKIEQLLLSLSEENLQTHSSTSFDAVVFKKALDIMNENIFKQITVDELAKCCNISQSGLKNIFTKYAGLGVHKYFIKLKINAAANLLKEGMSVTDIAEKLGYSSQGYFSHLFKRETGITPSEFINTL